LFERFLHGKKNELKNTTKIAQFKKFSKAIWNAYHLPIDNLI